jgi:hypothetical protein
MNFLNNHFKDSKKFQKNCAMHENFVTCNRYIPSSTKNINLDFYQDIRLENGVSMIRPIPRP